MKSVSVVEMNYYSFGAYQGLFYDYKNDLFILIKNRKDALEELPNNHCRVPVIYDEYRKELTALNDRYKKVLEILQAKKSS